MSYHFSDTRLFADVFIIGVLHMLSPVHWLSFTSEGKRRGLSSVQTLTYSSVSALIHLGFTSVLAAIGFFAGKGARELTEDYSSVITGFFLLLLALWVLWKGEKAHHENKSSSMAVMSLVIGLHPNIAVAALFMGFSSMEVAVVAWLIYVICAFLVQVVLVIGAFGFSGGKRALFDTYGHFITAGVLSIEGMLRLLGH